MSEKIYNKIEYLLFLAIEDEISEEQRQTLNSLLNNHPERISFAVNYLQLFSFLRQSNEVANLGQDQWVVDDCFAAGEGVLKSDSLEQPLPENEPVVSQSGSDSNVSLRGVDVDEFGLDIDADDCEDNSLTEAMLELLEIERTAPAVDIEKPQSDKRELIQKVDNNFKWFPGKLNMKLVLSNLALAASIMVFFGYVYFFVPSEVKLPKVARLESSVNAVWDDNMRQPDAQGDMVQSRYFLKKGFASIVFNDGAKVTVEAPADLFLLSGSDMELHNGRIYAAVPKHAHGFTVKACDNKIVDLGTEFGIEVDKSANTQLHVTKGQTLLFTGFSTGGAKSQFNVKAGTAKHINSKGTVKNVDISSRHFVRDIWTPYKNLPVANPSFERQAVDHKEWVLIKKVELWTSPPWITQYRSVGNKSWKIDTSPNGGTAILNSEYGYGGIAVKGKNTGFVTTHPFNEHCLYQELNFPVQSSRRYDLSVKIGNPSVYNGGITADYRIELLAGGTVIAYRSGGSPIDDSKWITARVSYTSGPDKSLDPFIGQPLAIRLVAEAFTEGKHVNFDDVKLVIESIQSN